MNKIYKAALLSIVSLAAGATVQAQTTYNGDLLIGFTSQSGNDLIYDLGAASSLTDGETWDLSSLLTGVDLTTVDWGVIGDKKITGTGYAWATTATGVPAPDTLASLSSWSPLDNAGRSIYQNFAAAGAGQSLSIDSSDDNSWNEQTVNGTQPDDYLNAYLNPNVAGLASDSFYQIIANGSAPSLLGDFTLNSNGTVTYDVTPTPEPSTCALLAVGSFLLLTRIQIFRKKI